MTTRESAWLTVFEGPDGGGKTTVARQYAEHTGARYVHLGPLPRVREGLARLYHEVMLPALLGHESVVMDRSWLSEAPYGHAFRDGADRVGAAYRRMLERVALRAGGVVVSCLPPWKVVKANFKARKAQEMLETESQLRHVYELYLHQPTALPEVLFDYTKMDFSQLELLVDRARGQPHPLEPWTVGEHDAPFVLVGQDPCERKDTDPWLQSPFVSFSREGCSAWLAESLEAGHVPESDLLWVNADQDLAWLRESPVEKRVIVALGEIADDALDSLSIEHETVPHPQSWKRFKHHTTYPLIDLLRGAR